MGALSRTQVILGVVVAALVLLGAGGAYLVSSSHQPAPSTLRLSHSPSPAGTPAASLAGTWVVDTGSVAGYRVKERFVGQPADSEAVARTTAVNGQLVIASAGTGVSLQSVQVSADLSQIHSTDPNATHGPAVRDNFVGRIYLETAVYPKANFVAQPQPLPSPVVSGQTALSLSGAFTLHGVTHDVTVPLQVALTGDRLEVAGSFQVHLNDYHIDVPSVPFTTAAPDGTVELHLFLKRA